MTTGKSLGRLQKLRPAAFHNQKESIEGILRPSMIVPYPLFMALHVGTAYMLAKPFPKKYFPALMVFGVVQSIIEHMADVFPTVAALGPPLVLVAIGLLGLHYKFAYEQMESKALCLAGLAGYFVILGVSKGFELGFPKDTGAEQVVALQDETYSAHHLVLHGCLVANLAITAFPSPATKAAPAAGLPGKAGLSAAKAE